MATKIEGMGRLNANGEYVIDELALARLTSTDIVNLINKITAGLPIEFFQVSQVAEFVSIDIAFMETAFSILYTAKTGDFYHEQMGYETIKRFRNADILGN